MDKINIPYEKMPTIDTPSSSTVLVDEPVHVQKAPVRIRHYFAFSLFSALCLCPATGLIALAYSIKSSAKADVNFHDKARLYSRRALLWNLISVIFTIVSLVMVLIFFYYFNEMMKAYGNAMDNASRKPNLNEINNEFNKLIQSITNEN